MRRWFLAGQRRPDTGATDGDIGDTATPRATKGVADDDGDVVAVRARRRSRIRVDRSLSTGSRRLTPLDIRQIDAGVGADEAVFSLRDDEFAAAAQDANRFRLDQRLVRQRIGRVDIDEATLGLRHDLLGDDEAVAVLKVSVVGGGDQFGEIVAGRTSPCRGWR